MLSSKKHSQKHLSFVITKQKVNHRLAVFAKSDSPFKCELGLLTFPLVYVPTKVWVIATMRINLFAFYVPTKVWVNSQSELTFFACYVPTKCGLIHKAS